MSTERFRLSPQQRRLLGLFAAAGHDARRPGARPPRTVGRIAVRGELDATRLAAALDLVARKHEILRTTFDVVEGDPDASAQLVAPTGEVALATEDLTGLPEPERAARIAELELAARDAVGARGAGAPEATLVRCAEGHHELLLALPGASADAASLELLARDLEAACASLDGGAPFDDEAMQYADVAEWLNGLVESEDAAPAAAFWRGRDVASGGGAAIPFQRAAAGRGAPGAFLPGTVSGALEAADAAAVADLAGRLGARPADVLLAAWFALLRRLSGERRLRVGVGGDGRRYQELEDAVGLLARVVPIPLEVGLATPFEELVGRVATEAGETAKWGEAFRWELSGATAPDGGAPYCAFAFEHRAAPAPAGERAFAVESRFACVDRFDVRLTCEDGAASGGGVDLRLDFDPRAFDRGTVERLLGQYRTLVAHAARAPQTGIGRLDVLAADEWRSRVVDFNATTADYRRGVCAHAFIEEAAREFPDRVAVQQGERTLTYAELDRRANRLAHHLRARGVGPDTLVTLCIDRSFEMVVGILGILKAGGAYVPIDPSYPAERVLFLLEDTRAPVLVTQQRLVGELEDSLAEGVELVLLDEDREAIEAHPATAPHSGVGPENLVYVIYTSGSTGKPKGVVITHEKLVISNTARERWFGHTPERFLLLSSVAFDSSVVGIFWSLCGGGTLELLPPGEEKDVSRIPAAVAAHGVTHLLTLPSFYRLILETAEPGQLASLRAAIVAGEACPLKMVEHHKALLPGVGLFSEYGATETTVFSSVYDCLGQTLPIAPVGDPIDNAEMYVLDEHLRPCPTGVPGEVHFGGVALALGYWRRPELTAERFVPHPFREGGREGGREAVREAAGGERLYKSGDLARHLESGDLEFLGRLDNQVKIRGFRVELEEIEVALLKHPALKETAVLARADHGGEKRLVGYVVVEDGMAVPSVTEVREFLLETLPDFMVPAVLVFLGDFPRTPNGKVDRKALPEPGSERPELESAFAAAASETEKTLAAIWADVLGLDEVGVHDNFFELGGDSILSIQIVSRAKQAGIRLTPRMLFENQTVAEQASVAEVAGSAPAVDQGAVTGPVPLTPVQRWFFALPLPNRSHWNMPILLELARPVDGARLETAMAALVRHHDLLRARYRRGASGWSQDVAPPADGPTAFIAREDLTGVPAAEQPAELAARAAAHHAALDLASGPLVRAVLFACGDGGPDRLLWIVHHLVVDGVSWRILLEDLELALDQLERGEPVVLPQKTTSFRRWAEGLEAWAAGVDCERALGYWQALAPGGGEPATNGAPATSRANGASATAVPGRAIPLDRPGGANTESSARKLTVALDETETRRLLTEVPKAYNTQIGDVLLTALVAAFTRWTGEPSLLLTLEGHGREDLVPGADLSRTVGWFTTDYPVRLSPVTPFEPGAALRSTREQLRAIPSGGFPFGAGRWLSARGAELAKLPVPLVGFNYLGQFDQVLGAGSRFRYSAAPSGPAVAPNGPRVFQLEVYGLVSGGRLELDFEYSENLHERATIERLAGDFVATLRAIVEHCAGVDTGGFAAADFADFDWDASDLEGIAGAIERSQSGAADSPGAGEETR